MSLHWLGQVSQLHCPVKASVGCSRDTDGFRGVGFAESSGLGIGMDEFSQSPLRAELQPES